MRARLAGVSIAVSLALAMSYHTDRAAAQEQKNGACTGPTVVAVIGEIQINDADLDALAREQLLRVRSEEYRIKRQVLEDYINKTLMSKDAVRRGISVEELLKVEIDGRITPVTNEQKRAVYETTQALYAGKTEAESLSLIEANLKRIRTAEAQRKLIGDLRTRAGVRVLLEPPRYGAIEIPPESPTKGPKGAPAVLVEFSDFQCPYCSQVSGSLKRLQDVYKERLQLVFRHFPLPNHKNAPKAAEAAICAQEQGRFWEMHDKLFDNQKNLELGRLKELAVDLGLDVKLFNECFDSGRASRIWQKDLADGKRHGITGTPTFFLNGRVLSGAQSYQNLVEIVEEELQRRPAGPPTAALVRP